MAGPSAGGGAQTHTQVAQFRLSYCDASETEAAGDTGTACTADCARTTTTSAALQAASHIADTAVECRIAGRGVGQDTGCCMGSLGPARAGQGSVPSRKVKVFRPTTNGTPWVRYRNMQVFGSGTTRRAMVPEGAGGAVVAVAEAGARKQTVTRWANRAQEPGVVGERAGGTQMEVVGVVRVGLGRQADIAIECQLSIV